MSTLKADAITAVTTNGDVSISGNGSGGLNMLSGALTQISIPADGDTWSDTNGRIAIHYF